MVASFTICLVFTTDITAQDTSRIKGAKHVSLIEGTGEFDPNVILGAEHQFRGDLTLNEDSSELKCSRCVYFFRTGHIAIELAEVDLVMQTNGKLAKLFFRKSFTETFIIPNKLKVQIIEMEFDVTSNQPALMNPLVTEDFMIFERSQLVYFNAYNDSTTWLANKVKVDLRKGDVILENVEVFKPYNCEIVPENLELRLNSKGNFYSLNNAALKFPRFGDMHEIFDAQVKFTKQSTWFKAKGYIEGKGDTHKIKNIYPVEKAGVYEITGTVKGLD